MPRGYKNLISEIIPNAQVVADRFHVRLSKAKKHFPISQKTIIRWIDEIIASESITAQLAVQLKELTTS